MTRAQWMQSAEDITATPHRIVDLLTVGQLSDATGLAEETLSDSLTRAEITNPDNPRGALCRPTHRMGAMPLWSKDQATEYHRRVANKAKSEPPTVSPSDAAEQRLFSTVEFANLLNLHVQTLRRAQKDDVGYPPAVARRTRGGRPGVPEHVRAFKAMLHWAEGRGHEIPGDLERRVKRLTGAVGPTLADLPKLSRGEVRRRGLVDLQTVGDWWGLSLSGVISKGKELGGLPEPVGRALNDETHQWRNVYESNAVLDWGRANGFEVAPDRIVSGLETAGA